MIIGSLISEKKVSRLAQTSSYATGLLTARTSQTVIVNFPPVLDPYRLVISFIAFINVVCCL